MSTPSEKVKEERANAQSREEGRWQHMGFCRDQGYYYLPGVGALQPALCLDAETVALRDAMRLRHLPKSPYEDRILADYYGATFAAEKEIDPESLPKQELSSDEFPRDPTQQPRFPSGHDEDQRSLLASLTAERIRSYSEAYQKAELHLDAVDQAHGSFRPCPACHPHVSPPQWIDETPVMKKLSQWKGLFTNVVLASLLIALALSQFLAPLSTSAATVASRGGASSSSRADVCGTVLDTPRAVRPGDTSISPHRPLTAPIPDGRFFLVNYGLFDT